MRFDRTATAWAAAFMLAATPVTSQEGASEDPPLLLVDAETRVASVEFRFVDGDALDEGALREGLAYRGPGALSGVRSALDFLPLVSAPELEGFSPLVLQRDLARLRLQYRRAGFAEAELDYEVTLDAERNEVDITFVIEQGEPLVLDTTSVRWGGDATGLAETLEDDWSSYAAELSESRGRPYSERLRTGLENQTTDWLLDRGYPWASARIESADTLERAVHAHLRVTPGPRARVAEITTEGNRQLSASVVRREIPLEAGDWYDAASVSEGERQLYELDLVRRALGDVPSDQPRDSTVRLQYRIEETRPNLVWGRIGWRSEAGASGEAHWSHRNFFGGARTLTVSSTVETGWGAVEQTRGRSGGLSATVRQPYVWHRNLSATFGPFLRLRDDFRDRSVLYGLESALIWRARPLRTVTLQHELSRSRVDEAFQLLPLQELVTAGPRPFDRVFVRSVFKLTGSYGTLDDRIDPRSGYLLEPNLEITGPTDALSDVDFFRVGLDAAAAVPLSRTLGLHLHASGGRLFPYGQSRFSGTVDPRAVVGLRGVMFTAGGTSDVRGWAAGSLGPKIPDVSVTSSGYVSADRYVPVGGLARLTGSAELALPFPLLPAPHGTFVFVDVGRVWTPGDAFEPGDPELAVEPWGVGVGGGLQLATPVGPLRLAVGYKVNPTKIDLLDPGDVARSLAAGDDLSGLEADDLRRWHLHLAIGRGL